MTIVADESVDFGLISLLRQKGIIVNSISEINYGIKDEEVLSIAVSNLRLQNLFLIGASYFLCWINRDNNIALN